jgi:transposase-like protein
VEALSIPAYDHYLEETMEPPLGLSIHLSYRRATSEVQRIQGQSMSHTTVHSRLQKFAQHHCPSVS